MNVIVSVGILFLLMAMGLVARHLRIFDDSAVNGMSGVLINIAMPSMIIIALQQNFSMELLVQAGATVGSQFFLYAMVLPLTMLALHLAGTKRKDRGILEYGTVFGNVAFMGFPVISAVYGNQGLFLASLCVVPFSLLAFSIGAWIIARRSTTPMNLTWRTFINANSVATVLGFLLFLFSIKLPYPIFRSLELAGSLTTPLSMILSGYILGGTNLAAIFRSRGIYVALLLRLFIFPALFLVVLMALGFRGMTLAIPVILAAMPAASNTPVMARLYGGDDQTGSAFMAASTLLCVVSIPLAEYASRYFGS